MKRILLIVCAMAVLTAPAVGEQAAARFNQMYAQKIRAVGATPGDTADDLALARQMVAEAPKHRGEPQLLALICDRAYKLAAQDPAGRAPAIRAMQLFAAFAPPEQEIDARARIVDMRQAQYTAARGPEKSRIAERLIDEIVALGEVQEQANDYTAALLNYRKAGSIALATRSSRVKLIQAGIAAAADRQRRYNEMQRLLERHQKNPDNAALAGRLARMYLFDFDDPAGAVPFAAKSDDQNLRQNVALIQKPIDSLNYEQASSLGLWYQGKGFLSDPAMRGALHLRAHAYYRRAFEAAAEKQPLQRQALASLDTLHLSLQEVGIAPPATPMLASAEPARPARPQITPKRPRRPEPVLADASPSTAPRDDSSASALLERPVDDPTRPRRGRPTFFGIPAD